MPHFFIKSEANNNNTIVISDKENYVHIARALRARVNERLLLIDENKIQYETQITEITKDSIVVRVINSYESKRDLTFDLFLAQSPLRSDAQSLVMEKATELGVKAVYPIFTDNCALSKDVIEKKIPKWQKVMYEASKQCERAKVPECKNLTTIDELCNSKRFDRIMAFCERYCEKTLKEHLHDQPIEKNEKILVIIGPEGGFSQKEFDYFTENNIEKLSLGNLILKAETAVVTALGNIIYEYQE